MKLVSLLASSTLIGLSMVGFTAFSGLSHLPVALAEEAEMTDATGLSGEQKVAFIMEHRGQFGGGDQLRRFFFGDLQPVSVQPGGAGMVVNLYNQATDTTFSYCATYDVVVAVGEGRVTTFPDGEVQ
ncbi:MAG: hypothetical protein VKL39_06605 [Leptolyngbyaceae bacterium]|nr:hypothetical protein [Leptolyngbyaceae bacterium]